MYAEDSVRTVYINGKHREPQDEKLIKLLADSLERQHEATLSMKEDLSEKLDKVSTGLDKLNENVSKSNVNMEKLSNKIDSLGFSDKALKWMGFGMIFALLLLGGALGLDVVTTIAGLGEVAVEAQAPR